MQDNLIVIYDKEYGEVIAFESNAIMNDSNDIVTEAIRLMLFEEEYRNKLGEYYDLSVFLNIDAELQRERILKRNTKALAKRFFEEWIPLENIYFSEYGIKECADIVLDVD